MQAFASVVEFVFSVDPASSGVTVALELDFIGVGEFLVSGSQLGFGHTL